MSVEREDPGAGSEAVEADGGGADPSIGVDEWVARSGERRDAGNRLAQDAGAGRGARRLVAAACRRHARRARSSRRSRRNVNIQTVAFNSLLYALLAMGLNIAVGWSGLLDLGYIAFFGFGAYGYAIFSSTALGTGGAGGSHLPAVESILIVVVGGRRRRRRRRPDRAAVVGRLLRDRHAVPRAGVRAGRQQRRPWHARRCQRPVRSRSAAQLRRDGHDAARLLLRRAGDVRRASPRSYICSTRREPAAPGARCNDDPLAAEAMTMSVNKLKVMAFSFAAMVGALAGTLFAAQQDNVFPDQLHRQHPDPDLRVSGARRRRQHRRRDPRWDRRDRRREHALEPDRRRLPVLRPDHPCADRARASVAEARLPCVAGVIAFGYAAHAIVGAIAPVGDGRAAREARAGSARSLNGYVIVPEEPAELRQRPVPRADRRAGRDRAPARHPAADRRRHRPSTWPRAAGSRG